jgi:drug/metabolite transporter (DMT)-like permease
MQHRECLRWIIEAMRLSPKAVGITAAATTICIWTMFIVVARYMAHKSLTPWDIVACRIVGAALVLLPWGYWMVHKRRLVHPAGALHHSWLGMSPLARRTTVLLGAFGGVGYAVLAYNGFLYAPAAHASVLLPGMLPLSTALVSVWLLGEHLGRARIAALALIFAGAISVGGASLLKAFEGGDVWKGDLLFVCASTCWAVYTVLTRKYQAQAVQATIAVVVFCAVAYLPAFVLAVLAGWLPSHLAQAPFGEIAFQTFWQGMGSVVISGISFTKMVQHFGPVRSTMMTALVPGLSALGAVIFLGEPLHWNLLLGLALVTVGIVLGVRAMPIATKNVADSAINTPAKG